MDKRNYAAIFIALLVCFSATLILFFSLGKQNGIIGEDNSGSPYRIQVILKAKANPPDFWRIVEQGVDVAAKEYGVDCEVTAPAMENDVDRQKVLMESAIAKKPNAIIIAASDYERLAPLCEEASRQGIAIFSMDSDVNFAEKKSFIGTDNYDLGRKMAQLVDGLIGSDEKFGVMGHVETVTTATQRRDGLLENIKDSDNRLAALDYCEGSEEIAEVRTMEMLRAHPEIRCMVGLNESSALGVSRAIQKLGKTGQIKIVACDSSQEQIEFMEQGTIQAFVIQNPFNMGYISVKLAVEFLSGNDVPSVYDTGSVVITRETMYKQENQKLLFPFIN